MHAAMDPSVSQSMESMVGIAIGTLADIENRSRELGQVVVGSYLHGEPPVGQIVLGPN